MSLIVWIVKQLDSFRKVFNLDPDFVSRFQVERRLQSDRNDVILRRVAITNETQSDRISVKEKIYSKFGR